MIEITAGLAVAVKPLPCGVHRHRLAGIVINLVSFPGFSSLDGIGRSYGDSGGRHLSNGEFPGG